jgi:hypothetical protein
VVYIQTNIPTSKIFRFESYWATHPGFLETVLASWAKPTHKANSATNLNTKFKRLRYDLKAWSKSISRLSVCIENSNKALLELDNLEDLRPLTMPENSFRRILKKHLITLLDYQNQYWKKRCAVRWTKFEDENTNFFHSMATQRYRRNNISQLILPNGSEVFEHADKEAAIFSAFMERLGTANTPPMLFDLDSLISPTEGLEDLSLPFSKEEIYKVVKEMPPDKALDPDVFSGLFLKSAWHIIKEDIYRLCFDF